MVLASMMCKAGNISEVVAHGLSQTTIGCLLQRCLSDWPHVLRLCSSHRRAPRRWRCHIRLVPVERRASSPADY
jgi:hypothetical protein